MDFNFSIYATPSQKISFLNAVIFHIELFIYFITAFILFPFAVTLLRTRAFNVNLRIILFDLHISLATLLITRYMIVIPLVYAYYKDVDISSPTVCWLAKTFHDISIYGFGCVVWTVCIERSLASYFVEIYEYKIRYVGWLGVLFKWVVSVSCITLDQLFGVPVTGKNQNCLPCQREYNSMIGLVSGCLWIVISSIIGLIVVCRIYNINKRWHGVRKLSKTGSNLSLRYQISENVQMSKVLFPLMFALLIQTLLGTSIFLLSLVVAYFKLLGYEWAKVMMMEGYEFSQTFDILMAIYALSIPLICIIKHPAMKRRYIGITKVAPMMNDNTVLPNRGKTIVDTALHLTRYEATEVYFGSLEKSWEESFKLMAGVTLVDN